MKNKILFLLVFFLLIFSSFGKVSAQDEYDWDYLNYTIPAPIVSASLIGENKDVYAINVYWEMPETDEGDAYGFIIDKEGPGGREEAAVYYPPSLGFDDIINSGFYYDEAVLEGDTYNYYVKAYDRSGKESDWGKASVSIPLESKFEIELTELSRANGLKFSWWTKEFSNTYNKYVDVNTYSYLELDGKRYDGGYSARHGVQLDASALSSLIIGKTYQYRIKAYPNEGDENTGAKEITGEVTYNPCGIYVLGRSEDSIAFGIDKTSGTINLTFNGQEMTKTVSRYYDRDYGYFTVSGLEPFTVYDYQVQGCGGMRQASTGLAFSNVKNLPETNSATISWNTSLPSNGSVGIQGKGTFDAGSGTEHSATITGLEPVTNYSGRIYAKNEAGAEDSRTISFTTASSVKINGGYCGINWENVQAGTDHWGNPMYDTRVSFSTNHSVKGGIIKGEQENWCNFSNLIGCGDWKYISLSEGTEFSATISGSTNCSPYNHNVTISYPPATIKLCRTDTDNKDDCHYYGLWPDDSKPCEIKEQCASGQPSGASSEPAPTSSEETMIKQDTIEQNDQAGAILFETQEPTTTSIEYGTVEGKYTQKQAIEQDGTTLKIHPVKLENLKSRIYHYRIVAKDKSGKEYVSKEYTLKHGHWFFRFWGDLWERLKNLF